jgi:methylglutaconyl-CoA hydratase
VILYTAEGGIASITLNRPEKRNALNAELLVALREALQRAADDPAVRLLLIQGAGKDFCAGLDLSEVTSTEEDALASARRLGELFIAMRRHAKPIVAAVRGRALGGGAGLATASDLILAVESAQFGYPEVKLGFIPAIVTTMLRRSVGERQAFELAVGGEQIHARQAQTMGLINQVYPDVEFESAVQRYVSALAEKSATAMSLAKGLLYQMDGLSFEAAIEAGVQANALARMTDDFTSGVERFLKKNQSPRT